MLVSSIVGFNFGHPTAKSTNKSQSSSAQKQNSTQNQPTHCCPKNHKTASTIQTTPKLSLMA